MIAVRIVEILFPIFAIVLVGLIYGRLFKPDMAVANRLNMNVFIPCLLFTVLIDKTQKLNQYTEFALACALVILISAFIAYLIAKLLKISPLTFCLPMTFPNAGNLGLPLMVLTFGEPALAAAVVMFIVCNFLHISSSHYFLDKHSNVLKVFLTPMIMAVLLAFLLVILEVSVHMAILKPIEMLGDVCVPLMLFTLGVRLLDTDLKEWRLGLLVAFISPLIGITSAAILLLLFDLEPTQQGILILFGALPPAVMNYMFAEHFQQEPARVAAMVLFGNAMSIIILPAVLFYVLTK